MAIHDPIETTAHEVTDTTIRPNGGPDVSPENSDGLSRRQKLAIAGAFGVFALGLVAVNEIASDDSGDAAPTTTVGEVNSDDARDSAADDSGLEMNARQLAIFQENFHNSFDERIHGFDPEDIAIGDEVDWDANPEERGTSAFTSETLQSPEDIAEFLNGDSARSEAARQQIEAALQGHPHELQRALHGQGYIPVQFRVPAAVYGTTYFSNGNVLIASGGREVAAGDVYWLYTTSAFNGHGNFNPHAGEIVWDASQRADCGNARIEQIVPLTPGHHLPPVETPPPNTPPHRVPPKHDNGELPGDGTGASQDPGTPDRPGNGPAGQQPGNDGYLPGEEPPMPPLPPPAPGGGNGGGNGGGGNQPPATTTPPPTSTSTPPQASTTTSTTAPQNQMPNQP